MEKILAYNAKGHPIFKEHQKNWDQIGGEFTCIWDGSLKKLGYDGSRNFHHEKKL